MEYETLVLPGIVSRGDKSLLSAAVAAELLSYFRPKAAAATTTTTTTAAAKAQIEERRNILHGKTMRSLLYSSA